MRSTVAALAAAAGTAAAQPAFYPLETPDGASSTALAISADGSTVVGNTTVGFSTAAKWTSTGHLTALTGAAVSVAAGVSGDGSVVVGWAGGSPVAVRWVGAGSLEQLGFLPGGTLSQATAVSRDGSVIVGWSERDMPGGPARPVRWVGGVIEELPALPGYFDARAVAVSADGQAVAISMRDTSNNYRSALWTAAGLVDLGVIAPGRLTNATGMSGDASVITGLTGANSPAFRWTPAGIAGLPQPPNVVRTEGWAVSGSGLVIGGAGYNGANSAVYWDSAGVHVLVDQLWPEVPPGWTLSVVRGVAESGLMMAGTGKFGSLNLDRAWVARLRDPCYANCDHSTVPPVLNVSDFICFYNRFVAGDTYADCSHDTMQPRLNVNDFLCYMARYAAGCP